MNKFFKRLALLLAVLMIVSMMPVQLFAADNGTVTIINTVVEAGTEADLISAINDSENGATIKLTGNIELTAKLVIPENKQFTLNLGEYSITQTADGVNAINLSSGDKVTVIGTGTITGNNNGVYVPNGAELTVDGATIVATYNGIYNEGTTTVDGGTVKAIYVGSGSVTVNGGTIAKNGDDSFPADGGTLTITDGEIEGWMSSALTTVISGGTFSDSVFANEVTGGTFNGTLCMTGENPSITGATINSDFTWWSSTVPAVSNVIFGENAKITTNSKGKNTGDYQINATRDGIEEKTYRNVSVSSEEGGSHTVIVNANGTNIATKTETNPWSYAKAVDGDTYEVTVSATTAADGYKFDGWYLNGVKTEPVDGVISFTVAGDMTLVAKFVSLELDTKAKEFFKDYETATEFTVSTEDEMELLAYAVSNLGYTFDGKTVKLGASLDFSGKTYRVIGNETYAFKGTFDGGNNSISNITKTTEDKFVGLFGKLSGATVKNLTLKDSTFDNGGTGYAGGIVAEAGVGTTIADCTVSGVTTSAWFSGAVVGHTYGGVTVKNVVATGCAASGSKGGVIVGYSDSITISNVEVSDVKVGAALIGHANAGANVIENVTVNAPDAALISLTYSESEGTIKFTGENTSIVAKSVLGEAKAESKTVTVEAGKFTTDGTTSLDVSDYLASGKTQNEDGTIGDAPAYVATVNGVGYATLAEAIAAANGNGTVTLMTATTELVQALLDGQYGSVDGLTIELPTGDYGQLELGRAAKYAGSNTTYHIGGYGEAEMTFEDFYAAKNGTAWTGNSHYIRSMSNVTIKAADGAAVKVAGVKMSSGHIYGSATTPTYDYVLDKTITDNGGYYLAQIVSNIAFEGITFTAKCNISASIPESFIKGFTFKNCVFDINNTASGNEAIRYYNEINNGHVTDLVVDGCTFNNCFQGVYTQKIKNITVTNSKFYTTGHNAIAIQSATDASDHGNVVISGNYFENVGDRIIRFGNVGEGTTITITGNTSVNSGDKNGEIIKAQTMPDSVNISMASNTWGNVNGKTAVLGNGFKSTAATIDASKYETLDEAIKAANDGDVIVVNAGEYKLNASLTYTGKAFTIKAADGAKVSFDMSKAVALHGAKITFEGVTFDYKTNGNYIGLQHADTLVYNNCTINGMVFLYATNETFNGCVFNQTSADAYNVWTYGAKNVKFNGCEFYCVGKSVLLYNEGTNTGTDLTVTDTTFTASAPVAGKAAIEIDTSRMGGQSKITVDKATADKTTGFAAGSNSGSSLWNDKKQTAAENKNTTVIVDGEVVFEPAIIDLDTFIKKLVASGYNFDGTLKNGGKLTVKWSPVSGCYDTRAGHTCTVNNVTATGNTPKRVNSGLTQFQLFEGSDVAVIIKNVKFVYEPADFTVCENSGWKGSYTAEQALAGQLYFMTTGDVTVDSCDFEKVVFTTFNTTGTTTVKDCRFIDVYNNYAIKDIRGENVSVTGTTINNCGGGIMVSSTGKVSNVTITGNEFMYVDAADTAPDGKVGTRAILQIASSGDYKSTNFDFSGNTADKCGPVIRQLNDTVAPVGSSLKYLTESPNSASGLYTSDTNVTYVAEVVYTDGTTAKFETFAEALAATKSGAVVKLLANVEIASGTQIERILDLNGFTATTSSLSTKSVFTLRDSSADANGKLVLNGTAPFYVNHNFTLESGTIESNVDIMVYMGILPSFNMNDGTLILKNGATISCLYSRDVTINGGTIITDAGKSLFKIRSNSDELSVKIKGGDFTQVGKLTESTSNIKFSISGGKFSFDIPEEYCAKDYYPAHFNDGTMGVKKETVSTEEELRRALYEAALDGSLTRIKLTGNITLEMLYAAENFGTEKIDDNAIGDTFNRYKLGVHPTAEDPSHWNKLVTDQTLEERVVYGAYYHTGATDERIARLVIKAGQSVVIDLNGYTIEKNARATIGDWSNVCTDIIGNYGTLEIKDSAGTNGTIKGCGYISCSGAVLHNYEGGVMTVGAVNVDGNAAGMAKGTGQYVIANDGGEITINGTNVYDTATSASLVVNEAGKMTITGNATLNHPATKTINVKGGDVIIESATIISDKYSIYAKGGKTTITGEVTVNGNGKMAVEGGEIVKTADATVGGVPEGYAWFDNDDGTQSLGKAYAKIGETCYKSLADALKAANAGDTIVLLDNAELATIDKSVTIKSADGKQFEIKGLKTIGGTGVTLENVYLNLTGTLEIGGTNTTLTNCTIRAKDLDWENPPFETGTYNTDPYVYLTKITGTNVNLTKVAFDGRPSDGTYFSNMCLAQVTGENVTLKDCTFHESTYACANSAPKGTLTLDGCKFSRIYNDPIEIVDSANDPTIIINDCDLVGCSDFNDPEATVIITNCRFGRTEGHNVAYYGLYTYSKNTTIKNCSFTSDYIRDEEDRFFNGIYFGDNVTVEMNECTLAGTKDGLADLLRKEPGNNTGLAAIDAAKDENGKYTSGTLVGDKKLVQSRIADGLVTVDKADGTFGVKTGTYVAEVGGIKYDDLATAIAAAKSGNTVKLLADVTADVAINKNITLDLGGKTLTGTATANKATLTIVAGATATVKNGTVLGTANSYYTIQNNGTATLIDVTATAGNTGSSMIDNWGTLTIKSGTYTGGLNVVKSEEGSTLVISGGKFTLDYAPSSGYTATILVYGDTTISGGEFIQNATPKWGYPQVVMTGIVDGYTAITRVTGGTFTNKKSGDNIFHGLGKATSANFEVSGGTFNKKISDGYCADGFIPTKNADGTYGVKEGMYVAKIGSTGYETLADAIKAVKANKSATITLLDDIDISTTGLTIPTKRIITLDLNGHTLKVANTEAGNIKVYGNLTLKDSTDTAKNGTGTGKIYTETPYIYGTQDKVMIATMSGGEFTMESGLIDAASFTTDNANVGHFAVGVQNENGNATVTINGGHIKAGWYAIAGNGQNASFEGNIIVNGGILESVADYAIYHPHAGTTTINGGVVFGAAGGISLNRGKLVVNGGTITSKGTGTTGNWGDGTGNQAAAAINVNAKYETTTVEIKGGTIIAEKDAILLAEGRDGTIAISGGTFSSAVKEEYCADGYIPTQNDDGTYGVKEGKYVAQIGDVKYETLAEAVAAVAANGEEVTIKLLSDITAGGIDVVAGQNIVFDFDGHTYTLDGSMVGSTGTKTNGFRFLKGSTVVLKNGTLANGNESPAKAMINSYATLKLIDFSVDARTTAVAETGSAYGYAALYISNGVTTVTGNGNYTTSDDNFVILVASVEGYTDGASLVFDKNYTGTVSGRVSTGNKQNATVEIKNGKFDLKTIDVEGTDTTVTIFGGKFKNIEIAGKYLDSQNMFATEADADGYYDVKGHPITGIGLSIGEDISLRVIVREGYQDGKLFYSYINADGNLVEEEATIGRDTSGNYVFRIYNINPQRAGTIYTLRYVDKGGNNVGTLKEASILTYLEGLYNAKIENETATKEAARKVYIANFLEYCAAAATRAYPNDKSRTQVIRDLMNKLGLTATPFTLDEDHAGETYNDNAEKVFTGLGIEYGSIMRIYYTVSEEAYNAGYVYKHAGHVISNPIEIVEGKNGNEYRLYLDIPPYEYFSGQTITVEDGEGNRICVYACTMGRILLRYSNTEKYEEKVTSVARAAFDYCAALKAYLRSK